MISYIDTYDMLRDLAATLRSCDRIAVDTEAASFHRYSQKTCLVQVSTTELDAVIDPNGLPDLEPLHEVLRTPKTETVMHDADSDLRVLDRDFRLHVAKVFDTRVAAQLLGEPGIGLAALLEKYLGETLDKRFQRADWSQRPLTPEMIEYAASDTRHLHALRSRLHKELESRGRLEWAEEEFAALASVRWTPRDDDDEAYLRVSGVRALPPPQRAVMQALYDWRDATAQAMDRAPFRVIGNEYLVAIARVSPRNMADLKGVPRLPPSLIDRYGDQMLAAVEQGITNPKPVERRDRPRRQGGFDPGVDERLQRLKALRAAKALELGLEAGVLCPNATLTAVARAWTGPRTNVGEVVELRRWQWRALGDDAMRAALTG